MHFIQFANAPPKQECKSGWSVCVCEGVQVLNVCRLIKLQSTPKQSWDGTTVRRLPEPGPRKGIKIEFQVVALLVYRLLLGALNVRNRAKD